MRVAVRVKICGLRSRAEVEVAVEAGARYVGMVFYPASPRHLSLADARWVAAASTATSTSARDRSPQILTRTATLTRR